MEETKLLQMAIRWNKARKIIKESDKRFSEKEQKAFQTIVDSFSNKNMELKKIREQIKSFEIYLDDAMQDDLFTAVDDFVNISRTACNDYASFHDLLISKTFIEDKTVSHGRLDYDGDYYIGEHKDGERNGLGKYFFENGGWAEGTFIKDALTGHARRYYKESNRTDEGEYIDWERTGKGKMTWASGYWYEGEWNESGANGYGTFFYPEVSGRYTGSFVNGNREGTGKMVWDDGCIYQGDWRNDNRNGRGRFTWSDGEWYEGEWLNSKISGQGTRYYPTWNKGATYTGAFKEEKRNGKGKLVCKNGDWYDGDWLDNAMTGYGIHYEKEYERRIEGTMLNGSANGQVTVYWDNGNRYVGQWHSVNHNYQGEGTLYRKDGSSEKGKWVNGSWQKSTSFSDAWKGFGMILNIIGLIGWWGGAIVTGISSGFWSGVLYAAIGLFVYGLYVKILEVLGLMEKD